eukprot:TRINITY_DN9883_c0_g1_i1.p1 TRINITY_DN9883_c0_g1~~TRINITY_DN9883_c0_g1_i1.p1  ORF type:complete len:688 (-),score=138.04 TRINITY_DN9883_c0_g1_i1:18-2081(-)
MTDEFSPRLHLSRSHTMNGATMKRQISITPYLNKSVDELRDVLVHRPDVMDMRTENSSSTLLHMAVKDKNIDVVSLLLEFMVDINLTDFKDKTPFLWAVERNSVQVIDVFIENRQDIDTTKKDINGMNSFQHAILNKKDDIAFSILEYTSKQSDSENLQESLLFQLINDQNVRGYSSLHMMVIYEQLSILRYVIEKFRDFVDFEVKDNNGRNPLHLSSINGLHEIANELIPNVNLEDTDNIGNNALHYASKRGHILVVNSLLESNISVNVKNDKGETPLHIATIYSEDEVANVITKAGGDVSIRYDESVYIKKQKITEERETGDIDYSDDQSLEMNLEEEKRGLLNRATVSTTVPIDEFGYIAEVSLTEKRKKRKRKSSIPPRKKRKTQAKETNKEKAYWNKLILNWVQYNRAKPNFMRKKIYGGIPDGSRADVWKEIFDIKSLINTNPGVYDAYVKGDVDAGTLSQIDIDINRACRRHILYAERFGPGQISLFNVLRAYSAWDPVVGYCQGMSDLTAFLLLYIQDEQECFWILTQLLKHEKWKMQGFFSEDFSELRKGWYIHNCVLKDYLPKVYNHFEEHAILPQFYVNPWFLKIFLDSLSDSLVRRVWDIFLYEGSWVIYTINMCLLKSLSKQIVKLDAEGLMLFWKQIGSKIVNDDLFMNLVLKNLIPQEKILEYEQEYLNDGM